MQKLKPIKVSLHSPHSSHRISFFGSFLGKEGGDESLHLPGFDLCAVHRIEEQPQLLQEILVDFERDLRAREPFWEQTQRSIGQFARVR